MWAKPIWTMLPLDGGAMWQVAVGATDAFVTTTSFSFEGQAYGVTGTWRVPLSGDPATKIAGVSTMTQPMVLDGTTLYMVDVALPRIASVDTISGESTTVGAIDDTTTNVAVDASFVYWSYRGAQALGTHDPRWAERIVETTFGRFASKSAASPAASTRRMRRLVA